MRNKFAIFLLIGILFPLSYGCAVKLTDAIHYGKVEQNEFVETVDFEIKEGLIFVPVIVHGKEYRFLFDSGAPFSISDQLRNDYAFKIVSKGNIIDSDDNRKKVNWAQVDSINIGHISFMNQTAFIGDFDANPILQCLEIDGIIGSNLMRHCNWTIDQEQQTLSLNSTIDKNALNECAIIPFKTDYQYNILIDLNIGQATVRNILMDYGSNGSIALSNEIFTTLKDRNIISEAFLETGVQQNGIIGEPVILNREISLTDSVSIDSIHLKKVMLRTGKTVSVGNNLLSRFSITIDWNNRNLYLCENGNIPDAYRSPGFKLGYSTNKGMYVQSVIKNSIAFQKGVRPKMKVAKIDGLDFENGNDFCDYVGHELSDSIFLQLIDPKGEKLEYHIENTILNND